MLGLFGVGVIGAHHGDVAVVLCGHDAGGSVFEQCARHFNDAGVSVDRDDVAVAN